MANAVDEIVEFLVVFIVVVSILIGIAAGGLIYASGLIITYTYNMLISMRGLLFWILTTSVIFLLLWRVGFIK